MRKRVKLQETVLTSHRELKGYVAQVETSRVQLKYLGQGFLTLVFMIGTLAGRAVFSRW